MRLLAGSLCEVGFNSQRFEEYRTSEEHSEVPRGAIRSERGELKTIEKKESARGSRTSGMADNRVDILRHADWESLRVSERVEGEERFDFKEGSRGNESGGQGKSKRE